MVSDGTLKATAKPLTNGPTVRMLWECYWQQWARHKKAPRDLAGRWARLSRVFAERQAMEVTGADVERYRDARKKMLNRRGTLPRPATINAELVLLKRVYNFALEQNPPLVPYSPVAGVKLEAENNVRQTKVSREADLDKLLNCCSPLMRALVLVLYDSGMRRMEAMRLRWDQFDHQTGVVTLVGSKTKNGKPRKARLTSRALNAVMLLPQIGAHVFANDRRGWKFFGRPYNPRYLYRKFQEAVAESGLEGVEGETINLHTLRHSFAYVRRVRDRLPERTVMALGGWRSRSAFDRYGIEDESELDAALETVEANITQERQAFGRKPPLRAVSADGAFAKKKRTG